MVGIIYKLIFCNGLTHILSGKSHSMEPVQVWAKNHLYTLQQLSGQAVSELDFTDDRLAMCLRDTTQQRSNNSRFQPSLPAGSLSMTAF